MAQPKKKLRSWRVSILRQRAQYIGTVKAPDERTAEAARRSHSSSSTTSSAGGWR
jgi:hypothetical protein